MEPAQSLGLAHFLSQADTVARVILVVLLGMSAVSWHLIVTKTLAAWLERRRARFFVRTFWNAPSLDALREQLAARGADEPFSRLASRALASMGLQEELLTRAMRRAIDEDTTHLESG